MEPGLLHVLNFSQTADRTTQGKTPPNEINRSDEESELVLAKIQLMIGGAHPSFKIMLPLALPNCHEIVVGTAVCKGLSNDSEPQPPSHLFSLP